MAGSQAVIEIRQLFELDEFREVVRLQDVIWKFPESELLPVRFLVVVSHVGGHVFGAYDGGRMIGFCFAIPGIKADGQPYLHSHMLGVLPEYRNLAVGRRLKLRQREDALARGIALIEWTFDPLQLKNAFFNVERLGAVIRRYAENQYGDTGSPLNGGLPTDRCYAEWWIDSPRVHAVLAGQGTGAKSGERIALPSDFSRIVVEDNARAREIQKVAGAQFRDAFARGLQVTGFERSATAGTYILEPWK